MRLTTTQGSLRLIAVGCTGALLINACSAGGQERVLPTVPPPVTAAPAEDQPDGSATPTPVALPPMGPEPAVIHLCLDTGPSALSARAELVRTTVEAIGNALRGRSPGLYAEGRTLGPYRRGLVLQVWSTQIDSPPLFEAKIPGPDPIAFAEIEAGSEDGVSDAQLIDFEDRQDVQILDVMPAIDAEFSGALDELAQVQSEPATAASLGACVERANVAAAQWSGQHRLLIVVSDYPLPPPSAGGGTWDTTRAVMLLGVSADAPTRFAQWAPVWESWGLEQGERRFEAQLEDGLTARLDTYVMSIFE